MPAPPRKTALLIGNGRFDDPELSELTAPLVDVEELRRVLEDPSIGGFDDVTVLKDADFAKTSEAIGFLFESASSRDDTIVLYYSGHGLPDDHGNLYLATQSTSTANRSGTAITASGIKGMMSTTRSRRQVLILDCCYSGAFGAAKDGEPRPISPETFITQGFGQHVLTASLSVERAYEGNQEIEGVETSLFTHFLIHGLETGEAARAGEELVTVGDLYNYVHRSVVGHTDRMKPQIWVGEGQGDLVIARNPKPYQLPDELKQMLESDDRYVREGAVRILGQWLQGSDPARRDLAMRVLESLNESEENRYVAIAIEDVLRGPAAPDETAVVDETEKTEESSASDESSETGQPAVANESEGSSQEVGAERQPARLWTVVGSAIVLVVAIWVLGVDRFYYGPKLMSASAERDKAQALLDAANLTIARLEKELEGWHWQDAVSYRSRARLAEEAASKCGGLVSEATGFQCPLDNEMGQVMLAIPSGRFTMGSPDSETGRNAGEARRVVQIAKSFAIGKYEVTFDDYERFARATDREVPSDEGWGKGRRPVINVTWDDAKAYAKWLSKKTGQAYRLPTEAEWEYAARAGTTGAFSFEGPISPNKANYDGSFSYAGSEVGEFRRQTVEVGSFSTHDNLWGLNDVHGNVWEWVEDCYGPYASAPTNGTAARAHICPSHVTRGGSWFSFPKDLRSAKRLGSAAAKPTSTLGFRLAQDI